MHKSVLQKRVSSFLKNQLWYAQKETPPDCPICLQRIMTSKEGCLLCCGHWLCLECAVENVKVCPLCRA